MTFGNGQRAPGGAELNFAYAEQTVVDRSVAGVTRTLID